VLLLIVCGTIGGATISRRSSNGAKTTRLSAPFPARSSRPSLRALAAHPDESDGSGAVFRMLPLLGGGAAGRGAGTLRIDGKTSRGSHDRGRGREALHLVSAFATRERLVLGQERMDERSCEQDTIPLLLEKLAATASLAGALVTIDAIACNAKMAQSVLDAGADYLLAVKANQPRLLGEIERFFADAPGQSLDAQNRTRQRPRPRRRAHRTRLGRHRLARGRPPLPRRISLPQNRRPRLRQGPRQQKGRRPHPDPLLHRLAQNDRRRTRPRRARPLSHRLPPLGSRCRLLRGPRPIPNRQRPRQYDRRPHFAFNLVRALNDKRSLKIRRKKAERDNQYLAQILNASPR